MVGLYALMLGVENLEENRLQSIDSKKILYRLDNHLSKQDEILGKDN